MLPTESSSDEKDLIRNINSILIDGKEVLSYNEFDLKIYRKNTVFKVFSHDFMFLMAVSYFNSSRLLEVVKAGLISNNKIVKTEELVDEKFVSELSDFLKSSLKVKVILDNSSISVSSNDSFYEVFSCEDLDKSAINLLMKSFCLFLAMCGKIVSNNINNIEINDYGFTNWRN